MFKTYNIQLIKGVRIKWEKAKAKHWKDAVKEVTGRNYGWRYLRHYEQQGK